MSKMTNESGLTQSDWHRMLYSSTIRYNTIEECNMDSKAECVQYNLAHRTKTNKRQCPLSSLQVKIREGSPERIRKTMEERILKEMSFKSGVKGRGSDRW